MQMPLQPQTLSVLCMIAHLFTQAASYGNVLENSQKMEVTDWPSKGYDMNPIENVWAMMVRTWDIGDERTPASIEIMRQQNGKL